jgi:hypothetical protein
LSGGALDDVVAAGPQGDAVVQVAPYSTAQNPVVSRIPKPYGIIVEDMKLQLVAICLTPLRTSSSKTRDNF